MIRRLAARAGLTGGAFGVATAVAAAGTAFAVERVLRARAARAGDPYAGEAFGSLVADRTIEVTCSDGLVLQVEEDGAAAAAVLTVVFVHGYGLHSGAFHLQRRALRAEFGDRVRLLQYDQRGHGRTERGEPGRATVAQLAADLGAVIDATAPTGPVLLVGHALGGLAMLKLAQVRPALFDEHVVAVAFLSTPPRGLPPVALGMPTPASRTALLTNWLVVRRMAPVKPGASPATLRYLTRILAAATKNAAIADFYPDLVAFDGQEGIVQLRRVRAVVLCGDADRLIPAAHSQEMAKALADSELHILPEAGHVIGLERPQDVNGVLIGLVREVLVRRSTGRKHTP